MNERIYNWLYKSALPARIKFFILSGILFVLVVMLAGGGWYWHHSRQQEQEELARQQAEALQRKRDNIHAFYLNALTGGSISDFLSLYGEILKSRIPVEMTGFTESGFSCGTETCNFTYSPGDTVFNVQEKVFRGESWSASFSQDSVEYQGIPSGMGSNTLLTEFSQHQKISVPVCNDVLNYIYTWNSLSMNSSKFSLESLPSSSVEADESSLPGNAENYGLLAAQWKVSLPDNYYAVYNFWRVHPWQGIFIIKTAEKTKETAKDSFDITGTFVCKK